MTGMDIVTALVAWIMCGLMEETGALSASFYGESYVWLPREDASRTTELQLEFRTSRADTLLFVAAGSPDYLFVTLQGGAVRVITDLGSGSVTLGSHPGLMFNDLHWHYIHLYRTDRSFQLNINNMSTITTNSPGQFTELNINRGLFLGSVAASSDLFYGLREYRGCMRNVFFNGLDVLHAAHLELDVLHVYEVNWECTSEFGASSQQPLSFIQNTSFVAFKHLNSYKRARFTFDLKTRTETGLLLYGSGRFPNSDFLAVELLDGVAHLSLNKGGGVLTFSCGQRIDDAMWHQLEIVINPGSVSLAIDGNRVERNMKSGDELSSLNLDSNSYLYVGGLGLIARATAAQHHLQSLAGPNTAAGSIIGCIQNFKINGALYGFREAEVTKQLLPECVWMYKCTTDPCVHGATCVEDGYYYYTCHCPRDNCYKQGPPQIGPQPTEPNHGVVHVQDLVIQEGGTSLILNNNINLIADYAQYGIRDSAVVFRVIDRAEHGSIQVELGQRESDATVFTMADIRRNFVSFVHDGSESQMDSVGLELEFIIPSDIQDSDIPHMFKERYGLTLMINVMSWNDKPDVLLPEDGTLVLVSNTQITITPRIMRAMDRDDPPSHLEYTVQYQHGYEMAYFEINDGTRVRARITSFTQEDINEGRISFIHRGAPLQQIRIWVSDRKDVSNARTLYVKAVPLAITQEGNTGLYVPKGSNNLILKHNLSFTTNTPNQDFPIRYEITVPPFDGEIQRQQPSNNQWVVSSSFSQQDIDNSRLRYFHYNKGNPDDFFKYRVYVTTQSDNPTEYIFDIIIVQTGVNLTVNKGLHLSGNRDGLITKEDLKAISTIPYHTPQDVTFTLLTLPRYGHLYLIHQRSEDRIRKKKISSNFTQADVDAGNVMFRFKQALLEPIEDSFQFRVEIPGAQTADYSFSVNYEPIDSQISFINNGLSNVVEGGQKVITRDDLFMQSDDILDFTYSVIDSPENGVLQLVNPNTGHTTDRNATSFSNRDILNERVYYKHDDSETVDDYFRFTATPNVHNPHQYESLIQEISEFSGVFEIKITLRNDNAPQRLVEKPFQVENDKGRILTLDDILYVDPDTDFDDGNLAFSFRHITNGDFVNSENRSIILTQFTQQDIAEGSVYFLHHGASSIKGTVLVSDGEFKTTGIFEVQVSDPYIRIINNTGLAVRKGEGVTLTTVNISIDSNLDGSDREFKFFITDPPQHGVIKKQDNERNRFNLADLKRGQVQYQHDNTEFLEDSFRFSIRFDKTQTEGEINVKIVLSGNTQPLSIVHNRNLPVEELQTTTITKKELLIGHPDTLPESIRYRVTKDPEYGVLTLRGQHEPDGSIPSIRTFTQKNIDENTLQYTHTSPEHTSDLIQYDVTNGISTLQQQEFVIEVIPSKIPLRVEGFSIPEGGFKSLASTNIKIRNRYFQKQQLQYNVVTKPTNGRITDADNRDIEVVYFSHAQVQRRKILYVHDDSDTTSDNITLIVKVLDTSYRSDPQTLPIVIEPVNDEPPLVVTMERLRLWIGAPAPITSDNLRVEDRDTPDTELMYILGNPLNGEVTLRENPGRNIVNFTQDHINRGQVIFRQKVDGASQFEFRVTDGESYTDDETFVIEAMQLVLNIEKLRPLEAYPGILQPITSANLKTVTNDVDGTDYRPIYYTLETKPENGVLVMVLNNGTETEVTTFSQADIDNRRVLYHHTSVMVGWTQEDRFIFEVSTLYAERILHETFQVKISYEYINEHNRDQLIHVQPPTVEEGAMVTITRDNLDISKLRRRLTSSGVSGPEISFVITELPINGKLKLNNTEIQVGMKLSQQNITRKFVTYQHDDSDTFWDAFQFSLDFETPGEADAEDSDFNTVFNFTIQPKNDEPFQLATNDPKIYVVQGFMADITQDNLNTVDPDTIPAEIYYEVENAPSHGLLVHVDNLEVGIGDFTQQDINDNTIKYLHDGSLISDAFYFKVTDGRFVPLYKVLTIHVRPLTLELHRIAPVHLEQGLFSQFLDAHTFNVTTNGNLDRVRFNVTRAPQHGQLYMNDSPVRHFSHANVVAQFITYIQLDATKSMDSFEFAVYDRLNVLAGNNVEIKVIAAMKKCEVPPVVHAGQTLTLTLDMLDAGHLANISRDNPTYSVTVKTWYGDLVMVNRKLLRPRDTARVRRSDDDDDMPAEYFRFTHEDIKAGMVQYKPEVSSITAPEVDSFSFILRAKAAQPAHGTFEISVKPSKSVSMTPRPDSGAATNLPPGKTTPKSASAEHETDKAGTTVSHLMIVYIVSAITISVIILIIIIKCVKYRKKKKMRRLAAMKEDSKTPLSQPTIQTGPDLTYGRQEHQYHTRPNPYEIGPRIPAINITPDSEAGSIGSRGSRASSLKPQPPKYQDYSNPGQPRSPPDQRPDITMSRPPTQRPPPPTTVDPHRSDPTRAVPMCKVTPLPEGEDQDSMRSEPVAFDWENVDPELLQHCRTTNPVLHENKYWV